MNNFAERVTLATQDLGSLVNVNRLTSEIEAITAALQEPDPMMTLGDLQRFRQLLHFAGAVIARLDRTVRSQINLMQGVTTYAG